MKLHPIYETGRLGLTDKEKEAEVAEIRRAIVNRTGKRESRIMFNDKTPQEIHRLRVIDAMGMADSCIVYSMEYEWREKRAAAFLRPFPFSGFPKEKREAFALTEAETEAIFKAQKERLSAAKIHKWVFTDAEGVFYNSVEW